MPAPPRGRRERVPAFRVRASGAQDGLRRLRRCHGRGARTTWPTPEAMVRGYSDEIAGVLAGQPCHLVGWSMGGLLAHAVAGVLEERGATVSSVSLWDCGFSAARDIRPSTPDWMEGAVSVLASLVPDGEEKVDLRATLRAHGGPAERHLGQWVSAAATSLWGDGVAVDTDVLEDRVVVAALHRHLFTGWRPGVVAAPLSVAWARHSLDHGLVTQVDWSVHTKSTVDEREVEGTHYSIVRPPNVTQLVDMLVDALGVRTARGVR
ncbi:thioesterase domain-containing protein [Actinophytocola glycyrrhizae]|uniref:Thioesterase domain-containing protein n=1 Tax=Actinophytocola glycyrrhizae TaxID=2044873 RepID=A0ABV9S7Q1_9PSEU